MSGSYLSSLAQPFDMVVATTQAAINGTMLEYMAGSDIKAITLCFVFNEAGDEQIEVPLADLKRNPFDIPANAKRDNADVQALAAQGFSCAMMIKPGVPELESGKFPNIIELGTDASSVKYNMMCSVFKICQITYGPRSSTWKVFEQPANQAWGFSSVVDLRLSPLDGAAISKLPADVQQKIREQNLGASGFSVAQLLFDLDNAAFQTQPDVHIISSDDPKASLNDLVVGMVNKRFMGAYWEKQKKDGQPLFHVAVTSNEPDQSEFRPTSVNRQVCPLVDFQGQPIPYEHLSSTQRDVTTMNYLCMSFNHPMPAAQKFNWNWLPESDVANYHGVISYNRNSFARWLGTRMIPQVKESCRPPRVNLPANWRGHVSYDISLEDYTQDATLEYPAYQDENSPVLRFTYNPKEAHDGAGAHNFNHYALAEAILNTSYKCEVFFKGRDITIVQELIVNLWIEVGKTDWGGDVVHKKLSDTYTLDVDDHGNMETPVPKSVEVDEGQSPGVNVFEDWFTDINPIINKIKDRARQQTHQFGQFPIALAQGFHFPGGKVFAFKNFQFSKFQDLTAQITYVEPQVMH
ncbi:hypothetical protein BST61_g10986 [Cercospora zeina]